MIRIKLLDDEVVETERHTHEQATAAKYAGVALLVGGSKEDGEDADFPAERTIYPAMIGAIERGDR